MAWAPILAPPWRRACSYCATVGSPEGSAYTSPSRSCARVGSARRISTLAGSLGGNVGPPRYGWTRVDTKLQPASSPASTTTRQVTIASGVPDRLVDGVDQRLVIEGLPEVLDGA